MGTEAGLFKACASDRWQAMEQQNATTESRNLVFMI